MDSEEPRRRPAVRIVCLDGAQRVLLLHWKDPFDGSSVWEPPGGGIDPGETPLQTARRELGEETGLSGDAVVADRFVQVERDMTWNGRRIVGPEQFFLARFAEERPELVRTGLMPDEQDNLHGHAWHDPAALDALAAGLRRPDRFEPPELRSVLAALTDPDGPGPWTLPAA
ncbi:NUDIX domain-containing protein [Dactylosporangium sp. CS-047395]|uniref:NUDIX domain-containing protein n=1 Tax=Dactylosporangium sp. CS-047395 TaxID=3239936 RepID=UPI003D90F4CF